MKVYRNRKANRDKILDYIKSFIGKKNYPPTIREICKGTGIGSTSTVHSHLEELHKLGLITKEDRKPRTLAHINEEEKVEILEIENGRATIISWNNEKYRIVNKL